MGGIFLLLDQGSDQAIVASSFSFATAIFIVPASSNTPASTPATIHRKMFNGSP
ncbi:MAG TPA: hypothetical protein VIZ43_15370 [Trebonia sp.]